MNVFITKSDFPDLATILKRVLLGSQTPLEKEEWKVLVLSNLKLIEPDDGAGDSPSLLHEAKVMIKAKNIHKLLRFFIIINRFE